MKLFKPFASMGVAAALGLSGVVGVCAQEKEFIAPQAPSEQQSTEAQAQQPPAQSQIEVQETEVEVQSDAALQGEQEQALKVDKQELKKTVGKINKASNLIGMKVKNRDNEDLGKIEDLAIDFESGKISYAVIGVGGFLGFGEKYVGIPLEALTAATGEDHLLLNASKQAMNQAKGFSKMNWPDLDVITWDAAAGLAQYPSGGAETFEGKVTKIDQESETITVEGEYASGESESREFKMDENWLSKFGRGDQGEKSLNNLSVGNKVTVYYEKQGDGEFVAKKVISQDESAPETSEEK